MQAETWDNVRPLRDADQVLGEALIEFGRMIENGTALTRLPPGVVEPFYREADFPAGTIEQARTSIERAQNQFFKGRLSQEESQSIIDRCRKFLQAMT